KHLFLSSLYWHLYCCCHCHEVKGDTATGEADPYFTWCNCHDDGKFVKRPFVYWLRIGCRIRTWGEFCLCVRNTVCISEYLWRIPANVQCVIWHQWTGNYNR